MADSANESPLTVLVEYQVREETTTLKQWLDVWSHRGTDALVGEPETDCYEAFRSVQDKMHVLVLERYKNGESSLQAHVDRPAHTELVETMGEQRMTKRRVMGEQRMTKRRVMSNFFAEIEHYGWWSRPEYTTTMREPGITMTLIVSRFANDDLRDRYIQVTAEHADYCRTAEPETLVYSGAIATRDNDRGPDIKQGDLLFVAAFANDAAAQKHNQDPRHLAVQKTLESVPRERVMLQNYTTTGQGYLWKPD